VFSVHGRLAEAPATVSALNSALGANQGNSMVWA
jgi:hypothetical protein